MIERQRAIGRRRPPADSDGGDARALIRLESEFVNSLGGSPAGAGRREILARSSLRNAGARENALICFHLMDSIEGARECFKLQLATCSGGENQT